MGAIAKTVTWTASCLSYSRRRWVRGRRRNASMLFLACIGRPGLTPNLALIGRRRTTFDLRGFLSSWPSWACARASWTRHRDVRRGVTCWASRRFILGFLAIQRVDGPSLAMLTHPSNSSSFLGQIRPGPLSCRAGHLAGVFFVTPRRVLVRAAMGYGDPPWDGRSGKTPQHGGAAGPGIP